MRQLFTGLAVLSVLGSTPAWSQPVAFGANDAGVADRTVLLVPETGIMCADGPVEPTASEGLAPAPQAATFPTPPVGEAGLRAAYDFSIAPTGRPLSIRPTRDGGFSRLTFTADAETQAALASWTFPAQARVGCRMTVTYTPAPLAVAGPDILVRFYGAARPSGALRGAVERRLRGPGDDCDRPPALRTLAYPDFLASRPRAGARSWSALRWNVTADGITGSVETIGSSGDAVLDAEGRRAIGETTYRSGPRTGCLYNYWRVGPRLPAPPVNRDAPDDPLENCPESFGARFRPGVLTFPPAFQALGIEGWARIRFDAAPWGQIGNASIVEAEPAAAFGDQALQIVNSSRVEPSFEAGIRCVVPIIFRLPDEGQSLVARLPGSDTASPATAAPPAPF